MKRLLTILSVVISSTSLLVGHSSSALAKSPSIRCQVPYSDSYEVVKTWSAWRDYKDLPEILENEGIHMLDLPPEVWETRRKLPEQFKKADWCAVHFGVADITNWALRVLGEMDAAGTMGKFSRVQKWLKEVNVSRVQLRVVEGFLKEAATELEKGEIRFANQRLGRALNALFGLESNWDLPEPGVIPAADSDNDGDNSELDFDAGSEFCGELDPANLQSDYAKFRAKLINTMNQRRIRPVDLQEQGGILGALATYDRIQARGPGLQVACAILSTIGEFEVSLTTVMLRFEWINDRQLDAKMNAALRDIFRKSVRAATDALAKQDFEGAHLAVDAAMVALGEPAQPSSYLGIDPS